MHREKQIKISSTSELPVIDLNGLHLNSHLVPNYNPECKSQAKTIITNDPQNSSKGIQDWNFNKNLKEVNISL